METNHEKICVYVKNNEGKFGEKFSYQDILKIGKDILTATPAGVDYAALKFLQQCCVTIAGANEAGFFVGDPREYERLREVKSSWLFWLNKSD